MKAGWTYKKLGEVCDILNGYAFKSSNYVEQGIRVIRITNVQKGYVVDDNPKYYPLSSIDEIRKYELKEGDLLMSLTGNVGRVGILDSSLLPAALNQRVACLRLKRDAEIIKQYIYHYLNSDFFEQECIKYATGAAQLNMSTVWLSKQQLPIPNISEQERIVAYLDTQFAKIDAMKANAAKALAEAKALFQSALTEAMTPKEGWTYQPLEKYCKVQNGFAFDSKLFNTNEGTPLIRIRDVMRGFSETFTTEIADDVFLVNDGDILVGMDGDFNVGEWHGGRAYLNQRVCKIITGKDICPRLILYLLPKELKKINDKTAFSTVKHLSSKQVNKILVPNLSLPEQERIVTRLDALSAKVAALEANYTQTVAECDALKQALLREVFE